MVRVAVDQAKRRGMRVWIIDEGKYPSGFAGGRAPRFNTEPVIGRRSLSAHLAAAAASEKTRVIFQHYVAKHLEVCS